MGRQLEMRLVGWGGKRKRAGRKPKGPRAGVSHKTRPDFAKTTPVHVTVRMAQGVWNLRSQRSFRRIQKALRDAANQPSAPLQVLQFSVQGNHVHFLVEARDKNALARGMQTLSVRIARKLNRMMGRKGRVMGDRYHSRLLRTPTEVRRAMTYIRDNHRNHMADLGERLPRGWVDPFSSEGPGLTIALPRPWTWLVREGWQRGSP